jgi:predicted GNAT family N-acyltransferase
MKLCEIEFGTPAYDEAVKLRYKVLKEPLGLDFTPEQLAEEFDQIHLATYTEGLALCAYLLLTPHSGTTIQMRQVAVEPGLQKKGIGKKLVAFSESWSITHGYTEMILHARDTAVPFYLKLGYKKSGKPFEEVGIEHWLMKKNL